MVFEVVLEKIEEAKLAEKYGAYRVELCTALDIGGLTPSFGLIKQCVEACTIGVHTMIRPRGGGFVYSKDEITVMKEDITYASKAGSTGVVFGLLNTDGTIDHSNTRLLTEHARSYGMEVTFHRAIDFCNDIHTALEQLMEIGVDRILTSGHAPTINEGIETISKMTNWTNGKIQITAGGGVDEINAKQLINLNLHALHFGIRKLKPGSHNPQMGAEYIIDEEKLKIISGLLSASK